jgi:creatinine amidohydrolase
MTRAPDPVFPLSWETATRPELSAASRHDPVAVLPLGAIEQHGPHLPISTDILIAGGILERALATTAARVPVVVLPRLVLGSSEEHLGLGGTLSLGDETLGRVLDSVAGAVAAEGIRRLVILNAHGGNKHVVDGAALRARTDHGLLAVKAHAFRFPRPEGVDLPEAEWRHGLHGGAVETAMMLHLHPELVRTDAVADFPSLGAELEGTLDVLLPEGPVSFAWTARDLNPDGVTGNATLATEEMGARLVEGYGAYLARVLADAARFPLDRLTDPW